MATSESSSAVLDLNDADTTEDTEAPSVTDGTHEGVPLIMEHGYDIAVKVDAPMKQLSTLETYVTYRVRCVCARWPTPPSVRRRYNHFKVLHKRLSASHPLLAPPALPPLHSARQQLDRYSPTFVAIRSMALDYFLNRVAKHPILTHSEDFRIFLTTPDEELDKIFKSENSALNLWGLSSALYGSGEAKPTTNGARVKDPEFTSASEYLTSLQQKLCTLCTLTNKLYKGSTALGNELTGMKRACDAWSCQSRGRVASACGACGAGAGGAGAARRQRASHAPHAATLPLLAAYAAAHVTKIRQRDTVHAAYVAGNNTADDLHNKLEQASEALRSELSDWIPKTRSEIKSILSDIADKQVDVHTQTLMSWERALKLSSETNVDELFKTVSKNAVQNLSPSKWRASSPSETERDLDEIDIDECSDEDGGQSVGNSPRVAGDEDVFLSNTKQATLESVDSFDKLQKTDFGVLEPIQYPAFNTEGNLVRNGTIDKVSHNVVVSSGQDSDLCPTEKTQSDSQNSKNSKSDFVDPLQDFSEDLSRRKDNVDSIALEPSSRSDGVTDPLQELSEVDLSS